MRNYKSGADFLNKLYKEMYKEVNHKINENETPENKINAYIKRLEDTHSDLSDRKLHILKQFYYKKYLIKELPDDYVELQKRIAKERGYGDVRVTEDIKKQMLDNIRNEQKEKLNSWIDYLTSPDAMYPMWFKNYAFQGMVSLGKYDKEKGKFTKRTSTTTSPFIEINPEVLGQMYNILIKTINKEELTEEQEKALINGESFKKMYAYFVAGTYKDNQNLEVIDGGWIKYEQGEDYKPLWKSLQGKNTGWCTAGEETCKEHIKGGDFYVYYTYDEKGKLSNPRIAIRMNGKNSIAEVRGINDRQNVEPVMLDILKEKLEEFPDKDIYLKKEHDMKLLTEIDEKVNNKEDLTKEELIFLYEINDHIYDFGFGWVKDPRIWDIRNKRNMKQDLAKIFDFKEENIGLRLSDFDKNNNDIYLIYNDTFIIHGFKNLEALKKLKYIIGDFVFDYYEDANMFNNLQTISGSAYFKSLKDATGLNSLQTIGGIAFFEKLKSAAGLSNLRSIGRGADFRSLKDATELNNLQSIGNEANFENLKDATGLNSLQAIGGNAHFGKLQSAVGLSNLRSIGRHADFSNLENATGLNNLQSIGGEANFENLKDATGLNGLQTIGKDAHFEKLKDATGLNNLQSIGGYVRFDNLTSLEGLNSNLVINTNAYFSDMITTNDIMASGITIEGNVWLGSTLVDKEELKAKSI